MQLSSFIKRVRNIISEPVKEFIKISKESVKPGSLFVNYTLPFLGLYTVASYLGRIVFGPATFSTGTGVILKSILLIILMVVAGIYLVSLAINEILPFFHTKKDITKTYSLITYSLTPAYISLVLSGLVPKLSVLFNLFGLYSVFLYWIATAAIVDMIKVKRQIFVPISLLVTVLVFLVIWLILGTIFLI